MITELDKDFSQLSDYINKESPSALFFLVDENTHECCLPLLLGNLETEIPLEIIEIQSGEEMKTLETAAELWQILAEFRADRRAMLISLGGGVVTDIGGFVASTYKRGIRFIHIPTTLLAMCDASIGGKTGIDLSYLKNMVGTFAEPERIFLYPEFLKTLPREQLRSGFAEMLKHGIIANLEHFQKLVNLPNLDAENLAPHIQMSMDIKTKVVNDDFRERNVRKTLNFGHTVGHAVESCFLHSGKPVPHGEAVAAGMLCEAQMAFATRILAEEDFKAIRDSVLKFFPKLNISQFPANELMANMINDKKNTANSILFAVPDEIGHCIYDQNFSEKTILSALKYYENLYFD